MKPCLLKDWLGLLNQETGGFCESIHINQPAIDSRLVQEKDIFFALPGKKTHGEFFLEEASQKGAVAAVVSKGYTGLHFGLELIFVENVAIALKLAATNFSKFFKGKIIGVTGSVGKTTVKGFLYQLLSPFCKVFASPLSYNSQITFPLSILLADGDEDYWILEMGSSEPGNIEFLISIAIPDIAIVTDINEQHALFYKNGIEGICQEKSKVLLHRKTKKQLLPKDSLFFSYLSSMNSQADKISFSLYDTQADFFYKLLTKDRVVIKTPKGDCELQISLPYLPAYINYLISVATFISLGFSLKQLQQRKEPFTLPSMRFEIIHQEGIVIINDAFNATPQSMLYAFEGAVKIKGRKIFILGQMNELGVYSREGHEKVLHSAVNVADILFVIGNFWEPFKETYSHIKSLCFYTKVEEVIKEIKNVIRCGDIVLLKGSRIFEMEKLVPLIGVK